MNRDDLRVFLTAGILALIIVTCAAVMAHAEETKPPARFTCWTVRNAVKIYKEVDLIAMARSAGMSEAEIEKAKRCLR